MGTSLDLGSYSEVKEHRRLRLIWCIVNAIIFPITTHRIRKWLLRKFGARVGQFCAVYPTAKVYAPWNLTIGDYVCIGPHVELYCKDKIIIGDKVIVSQGAYLCTAGHDISSLNMRLTTEAIKIESQVWLAANSTILPGVTIAEGSVVGACAVVSKDVLPWSVVVGNPARVVGKRELRDE